MSRNIVCEVDAPDGLKFQGRKIVSLKIANDGDADGYYIAAMEFEKGYCEDPEYGPLDAALEEAFVNPWLLKGRDF